MVRLTLGGLHHALDHRVAVCSPLRLAALRHLPRDHTRTQCALSGVIRWRNAGIFQEPQEVPPLVVLEKTLAEPLVHLALQRGAIKQPGDAGVDGGPSTPVLLRSEFFAAELTMQGMRVLEGLKQAGSVDDAPSWPAFLQHHGFFHIADHVMKALLMLPLAERRMIVDVVPVCYQRAPEGLTQQLLELLVGVPRADLEQHVLRGAGHLQPGVGAVNTPAGIVLMHDWRGLNGGLDLLIRRVHGRTSRRGTGGGLIQRALGHVYPAQRVQRFRDLALRESQPVVQVLGSGNEALPQSVGRRAPLGGAEIRMFASNILPTHRALRVG